MCRRAARASTARKCRASCWASQTCRSDQVCVVHAILQAARAAYAAGLAPLPTENSGSKRPDVGRWKQYQTTRPNVEDMRAFNFAAHDGLGIIAGTVSGCRECWDFDSDEAFQAFVERAHA